MIQPMHDRLLVKRLNAPPRQIVLTDAEPYRYFEVLAVGPKVIGVQVGDIAALPGVASEEPDHIIEEGQFIREADIGFTIQEN